MVVTLVGRMNVFKISVVFIILLHIVRSSPTGKKKRAQYLPPKTTNATQPRTQDSGGPPVNKTVIANTTKEEVCPSHLVPHNVSDRIVCCVPYFNCGIDHGIKACDLDGEKDQCIPCPPGWGQKNNVSSLNMEEAECYTTKHTENCAIDDMKPSRKYASVASCLLKCECKNEDCFYGNDPCACNLSLSSPCPVNFTMNRTTGVCERCPWYAYKDYVGCGTCTVIPELWEQRNSHTTVTEEQITQKKTTPTKTTKVSNDTGGQPKQTEEEMTGTTVRMLVEKVVMNTDVMIGVIVAVVVLFVVVLIAVIVYCLRRNKRTGSSSQLLTDTGQSKQTGENVEIPMTEIPDGFRTVGKLVVKNPEPAVANRSAERPDIAYEELGAVGGYDTEGDDQKVPNDGFDASQEKITESHEEMPLLAKKLRHNEVTTNRQNVSYPDLETKNNSEDEQSPLLNDIRKGNIQIDAKSGARPKTIQPKYARQLSGTKAKSEGALPMPVSHNFENCTFKKCIFNTDGPVLVNSPITEDSSLYTDESSDYSTLNPHMKMPFEIEAVLKPAGSEDRLFAPRQDRKYQSDANVHFNLPPNDLNDDVDFSEHVTTSNNMSGLDEENKTRDETKHLHIVQNKLRNVLEHDSPNHNTYDNKHEDKSNDKISVEGTDKDKNMESEITANGVENDEDQICLDKYNLNDSLTVNLSKDLNSSIFNDKVAVDIGKQDGKTLSLEMHKSEIDNNDRKYTELVSGPTSPTSSNGSDSDENRSRFRTRRKITFGSNNGEKPTAIIEPIRQNSTQESSQRSNQEPDEPSYGLFMSDLGSDSYPMIHADHTSSDVANIEDLNSLDPTSIGTGEQSSFPQPHGSVVSSNEMVDNEIGEREGPEGCSLQHPCGDDNDSWTARPDIQRTYSKTVEGHEETDLVENIARNLSGETFLKKRLNNDSDGKSEGDKLGKIVSDSTYNYEIDDDIDKEKLKNYEANADAGHDSDAVDKKKDDHLESEDETVVKNKNDDKDSQTEHEHDKIGNSDSGHNTDLGASEESDASVEIDIDCLANDETGVANTDSVELPNDINDQNNDLTVDSSGDCAERNKIYEDSKRRES